MLEKFKNVPVEEDTNIIAESTMKFGEQDILYQKWSWDGIVGESIIFVADDVKHLSDAELKSYVAESDIVTQKDKVTLSRGKTEYAFINFNFVASD